jgi:alkylation response protein AidB-like acyl-CoA dehydrogenase
MNTETTDLAGIADSAARLLAQHGGAEAKSAWPADPLAEGSLWQEFVAAGWFQLMLSEEAGGLGLGPVEVAAVFRQVGRAPVPGPLLEHMIGVPMLLEAIGSSHAKAGIFAAALEGRGLLAFCEPAASPFGLPGGAPRVEDGRLRGSALVRYASQATGLVVAIGDEADAEFLLLPADAGEIRVLSNLDPNADLGLVTFDCPVDDGYVILAGQAAARVAADISSLARVTIAAETAGLVETMTNMAVEHAKVRKQFGRLIGSFQAVQHMLANLAAKSDALGNLASMAAAQWRPGDVESRRLAALAKAHAGTTGRFAAEETLQILGGIGFTDEHPLHIYYRRALTLQGTCGEPEALLAAVGNDLISGGEEL